MRYAASTLSFAVGLLLLLCLLVAVDRALRTWGGGASDRRPAVDAGSPAAPSAVASETVSNGDADLVLEQAEVDLGRLEPGDGKDVSVAWRRTGPGPLRVRAVDTGCACVRGEGLPDVLDEGTTGALAIRFHGRTTLGPFVVFVRIVTDREVDAVRRLRLRGFVGESTILDPKGLHVGDVRAGASIERALALRPPPDHPVPHVQARLLGLEGSCDVGEPADVTAHGVDVRIHAKAPEAVGPFVAEVDVRMGDDGLWRVPLLGRVVATAAGRGDSARPSPRSARIPGGGPTTAPSSDR